MPYSFAETEASVGQDTVTVPFPYLAQLHVSVSIDGEVVDQVDLSWTSSSTIELPDPLVGGETVRVYRTTPADQPAVTFVSGPFDHRDLNRQNLQMLYVVQEAYDVALATGPMAAAALEYLEQTIALHQEAADILVAVQAVQTEVEAIQASVQYDAIIGAATSAGGGAGASAAAAVLSSKLDSSLVSAFMLTVLNDTDASTALTTLGLSANAKSLIAMTYAQMLTALSARLKTIADFNLSGQGGKVLAVNSGGTDLELATPPQAGALVALGSLVTISSATAAIDFTAWRNDTLYDEYEIHFWGLRPSTDDQNLQVRLSSTGAAPYGSGASDYYWALTRHRAAIVEAEEDPADSQIVIYAKNTSNQGIRSGTNGLPASGLIRITRPQDGTKAIISAETRGGNGPQAQRCLGYWAANAGAIDAIRLMFASGNIAVGYARMYARQK